MNSNLWLAEWQSFLAQHPLLQLPDLYMQFPPDYPVEIPPLSADESYWQQVAACFPKRDKPVNLNNGGVCSNALPVQQAFTSYYALLNSSPSFFTWKVMESARDTVKQGLASLIQASPDEIALFRNATEALNNAIFGIPLEAGDEVVACRQDYIKCVSSWQQREQRDHIRINWVELNGLESHDELINKYAAAITPKTKVLHLTHVINWNGLILPVKEIATYAKQQGLIVLLDAAHSFAVLETNLNDIPCDYMGTALHKWLSGPIAGGMLFIRKEQIAKTYPLASALQPLSDSIRKMEEMSIQVLPNLVALGWAIAFHLHIGRAQKENRLLYLRRLWTDQLSAHPRIRFNVPLDETRCKAFASFHIEGEAPLDIEKKLMLEAGIHVVGIEWPNMQGIRITPNIYTPVAHLHQFTEAVFNLY